MGERVFYVAARTFPVHSGMGLFSADGGDQALAGFVGQGDRVFSEGPVTDRKTLAALKLAEAPAEQAEAPAPAGGKRSKKAAPAEQATPETEPAEPPATE